MPQIRVLPTEVANRIAAGEVVERPASVVKELVENALDAGARKIEVEIGEGGRELTITDDGCGMTPTDARTALERFATSKIVTAEDLDEVGSYGFRGEALPSIAAVARVVVETRPADQVVGVRLEVEAGALIGEREVGSPAGTRIEIHDLFFNTPARAKFLKTDATEVRRAIAAVSRLALVATGVGFRVMERGRLAFTMAPEATALERLVTLQGGDAARLLFPFEGGGDGVSVDGFVAAPSRARTGGRDLYIYVNERFVTDRTIASALREAYRSLLPRGKTPAALVRVTIAPGLVDVNVHPAKHEVRFADSGMVWRTVHRAAKRALEQAPWAGGLRPRLEWGGRAPDAPQTPALVPAAQPDTSLLEAAPASGDSPQTPGGQPDTSRLEAAPALFAREAPAGAPFAFTRLRVLGQYASTYLACELDGDLFLMDQHAAHERVMFERLKASRGNPSVQRLLVPEMVELAVDERTLAEEHGGVLESLGFELSDFGGGTLAVHAVPAAVAGKAAGSLVRDSLAELGEGGARQSIEDRMQGLLARMACHAAIRAGDSVSPVEARGLLEELDSIPYAANCPHGRPVLVRLERGEIERWFGRT